MCNNIIIQKKCSQSLRVSPENAFSWKLLKIGSVSVRGIIKTSLTYKLIGPPLPHHWLSSGLCCKLYPWQTSLFFTCKLGTFFIMYQTLTEPIFNNFQLNGASGKNLKLWLNFLYYLYFKIFSQSFIYRAATIKIEIWLTFWLLVSTNKDENSAQFHI